MSENRVAAELTRSARANLEGMEKPGCVVVVSSAVAHRQGLYGRGVPVTSDHYLLLVGLSEERPLAQEADQSLDKCREMCAYMCELASIHTRSYGRPS